MQTVWKGAVSFGLVNVPVRMFTATKENDIPMKMLHRKYNEPIRYSHRLLEAIDRKVEGKEVKVAREQKPTNVIDLMEALKASLNPSKGGEGMSKNAASRGRSTGKTAEKPASEHKKKAPAKRPRKTGS